MLNGRHRIYHRFYSNRLRQTKLNQCDPIEAFTSHGNFHANHQHRFVRTECAMMMMMTSHKNQTQQHFDSAELIHPIAVTQQNHKIVTTAAASSSAAAAATAANCQLPFQAIPCADQTQTSGISGSLIVIAHQLKQLLTAKWDNRFHEEIDECHRRLGPIFRKSLAPNQSAVFVQSPELLRDVFMYEGKYPKHPLPEAWTFYNQLHNCQRGLFFMDDGEWLKTRQQLAPLMLRNEQRFFTAIECATDELIDNWQQIAAANNNNTTTATHQLTDGWCEMPASLTSLYGWSVRVLIGIMFGPCIAKTICNERRQMVDHFAHIVQNVFEDTVPFASISPLRAHKWRLPIWRKFERSVTETLTIATEIIDFGIKQSQTVANHDCGLLGEMAATMTTTTTTTAMQSELIRRIFIDLIIAAGDTTAFSTQWALYLLAQNQQWQQRIRDEVMAIDRHDSPLIRGTVREALRLFPVATLIGRILGKDAILGNYHVAAHTLVLISMYSAGRDEISFPYANQFIPDRWNRDSITGTLKLVRRAQSSIPYAMGARNCIGQRIANAQMHIILSKFLRTFHIQLLNPHEIDIVMRLIIMPSKPMRFAVKRID